jgi:hypothetical protein
MMMAITEPPEIVIERLRELIAALERRVPHIERDGEAAIARDAAELKRRAERRIRELEGRLTRHVRTTTGSTVQRSDEEDPS